MLVFQELGSLFPSSNFSFWSIKTSPFFYLPQSPLYFVGPCFVFVHPTIDFALEICFMMLEDICFFTTYILTLKHFWCGGLLCFDSSSNNMVKIWVLFLGKKYWYNVSMTKVEWHTSFLVSTLLGKWITY
jgi:hypothetical protein